MVQTESNAGARLAKSGKHFTCSKCGGTWEKERTDAEALAESYEQFGDVPMEFLSVVCEDCYYEKYGDDRSDEQPAKKEA